MIYNYKKSKKNVAILFGGQSNEHEISLLSSINIIKAINRKKYNILLIGIDKTGKWSLYDESDYLICANDPKSIRLVPTKRYLALVPGHTHPFIYTDNGQYLPNIDVVFSVLHGSLGENGSVQGLLNVINIPYIGSDVLGSAICMDKDITKRILRNAGVPVTPAITLMRKDNNQYNFSKITNYLGLPLFIKPVNQGSSIGVMKVTDQISFYQALDIAFNYNKKVLVEQAIDGREIEIAILGNINPKVSVCGEIIVHTNDFYSYEMKYLNSTQSNIIIPAQLPNIIETKISKLAILAYLALGCNIMARVDFFLTKDNKILVNEINTLPGFTLGSMYPKLWEASGLSYHNLINKLLTLTIS